MEREVQEASEKRQLVQDTVSVLEWQKQTREVEREKTKQELESERGMLKEQWTHEDAREKKAESEKFILNLERNKELILHN